MHFTVRHSRYPTIICFSHLNDLTNDNIFSSISNRSRSNINIAYLNKLSWKKQQATINRINKYMSNLLSLPMPQLAWTLPLFLPYHTLPCPTLNKPAWPLVRELCKHYPYSTPTLCLPYICPTLTLHLSYPYPTSSAPYHTLTYS